MFSGIEERLILSVERLWRMGRTLVKIRGRLWCERELNSLERHGRAQMQMVSGHPPAPLLPARVRDRVTRSVRRSRLAHCRSSRGGVLRVQWARTRAYLRILTQLAIGMGRSRGL